MRARPNPLRYYRDLVWVLLAKELRVRYKNTLLGYAWSVLNPLAFAAVFFVLFKVFVRIQMEDYALFLICGLFPWQWFQNSVSAANGHFLGNSSLIKKVSFPREFLVLSGVLNDLFHFAASLPVIVVFLLVYGRHPTWAWLYAVPALLVVQFAFSYGLALLVATCNLFFRDLERLTGIALLLWMYLTPVLFPAEMIPEHLKWCVWANPMAALIISWREVLMGGGLPPGLWAVAAGYAVLALAAGQLVYRALERRFAEIV
jgi:lipopolysaccharide transport system permease protein